MTATGTATLWKTQENIILDFLKTHPDIRLVEVYTDNGETGTKFDRPDFQRMMEDVRSGKINCIIVKDLSRFARDFREAGHYLEQIFPFWESALSLSTITMIPVIRSLIRKESPFPQRT